jgi:hypothetical protein
LKRVCKKRKDISPVRILAALLLVSAIFLPSAIAGELRYMVTTKVGDIVFNEYALWTNATWAQNCTRAVTGGGTKADQQSFAKMVFRE